MRKAINFYRSYYDIAKELSEKDRLAFLWAVLEKQFDGIEPNLKGMSNFAYLSQKHSIDSQVIGYETKTGTKLGGSVGGGKGGSVQEKGQGEVQGEGQDKEKNLIQFNIFRDKYQGQKRGNETEFDHFCKKHKDWQTVLPLLSTAIDNQIAEREYKAKNGKFVPEWKNLQTWINQRCWEQEVTIFSNTPPLPTEDKRDFDSFYARKRK